MQLAGDVVGTDALARAEGLTDGDVLLLENIRFENSTQNAGYLKALGLTPAS